MKKLITTLIAPLAAVFLLPGCVESETTVNLNKDGSGTLVQETVFGAQMMAMFGQLGGAGADPLAEMFSEEAALKNLESMGEGVSFEKIERIERGTIAVVPESPIASRTSTS